MCMWKLWRVGVGWSRMYILRRKSAMVIALECVLLVMREVAGRYL